MFTYPILRMEARVNDAVHVKVQVVVFAIRVWFGRVHRHLDPVNELHLVLYHVDNDERVLVCQPAVEGRDSHG